MICGIVAYLLVNLVTTLGMIGIGIGGVLSGAIPPVPAHRRRRYVWPPVDRPVDDVRSVHRNTPKYGRFVHVEAHHAPFGAIFCTFVTTSSFANLLRVRKHRPQPSEPLHIPPRFNNSSVETRILRSKSLLGDNGHVTTPTDR